MTVASTAPAPAYLEDLRRQQVTLNRSSTAERVAAVLREQVTDGRLLPGERLAEDGIAAALRVSRNTLREAFRLLAHERLLFHELNRGVFVRVLTVDDVIDLYRTRRLIEAAVLDELDEPPVLDDLATAVCDGELAAAEQRWSDVGTANMHFHQRLVALGGSQRLAEVMRGLLAELRLVFAVMAANPQTFHEPYLSRNRELLELLQAGRHHDAATALRRYLLDAERQLVQAYRHQ